MIKKCGGINDECRQNYSEWLNSNKELSQSDKAYKYIDNNGKVYQSVSLRAPEYRNDEKFHKPLIHPITGKPCPMPYNGFSRTPETLAEMMKKNQIIFGDDETTQPRYKLYLSDETKKQLTSIISDAVKGTSDLKKLGFEFPYCHSLSFYKTILSSALRDNNSITMDFFAGSGTTGHALIELNRQNGTNFKYILCEMGEYL